MKTNDCIRNGNTVLKHLNQGLSSTQVYNKITYDKDIDGRLQQEDARVRDAEDHRVLVGWGHFRIRTSCRGINVAREPEKVKNFKYLRSGLRFKLTTNKHDRPHRNALYSAYPDHRIKNAPRPGSGSTSETHPK